jgi:hypothetical protein
MDDQMRDLKQLTEFTYFLERMPVGYDDQTAMTGLKTIDQVHVQTGEDGIR